MHSKKAALIVFYIATRTVSIPTIGLQTDVGSIDKAVSPCFVIRQYPV